jgi:protein-disulfide isomerase
MNPALRTRRSLLAAAASALALAPALALGQETAAAAPAAPREVATNAIGDPNAPVLMIEYASFTCPHCRDFHNEVFPSLKQEYIDTGKVRFELREVYFEQFGLWAAQVARCAPQERYFDVVEMIYERQQQWVMPNDPSGTAAGLYAIGREVALTDAQMESCLMDAEWQKALVTRFQETATADGIEGTPSFVIDGDLVRNMPWEELKAEIDRRLGG